MEIGGTLTAHEESPMSSDNSVGAMGICYVQQLLRVPALLAQ